MPPFVVSPAAAHELLPACRLLFTEGGAEHGRDRILADAHSSGLFVARASGKLRAAALVQALPGALGVAWAPRGDSADAIDAVTATACDWLRSRGVKVCQAFAASGEEAEMKPLERAGFRHTTQLVFLRSGLLCSCDRMLPLEFTAARQPLPEELAAVLLATHEGTLDCPELNATRTPTEILAGFPSSSAVKWHFASLRGERIGVVMIESVKNLATVDLTYLGVVPAARRRGRGAELLKFALHEATAARSEGLTLSVDARNAPARRLYARHDFNEYDRREVWLASWSV